MMRFHLLLAGASWIGEYGDPAAAGDNVEEAAFLRSISPYHNIKSAQEVAYPKPFLTTSTKDDRVHPGHARKMVARLHEFGHSLLYYENINGGHAGSANLEEYALMTALEYTYMWQQLAREDQIQKK
jgi:prolyl oligopeptidase